MSDPEHSPVEPVQPQCRWGILGTAGIARKNWQAIRLAENATLVAVASRSEERSQDYIAENQAEVPFSPAPEAIGSYEELIAHPGIDAIYLPLPTGLRKEWVLKAAAAGKHVLSEKPCGRDVAEVEEMIAACREAGVQFMDGVMFMHSERLDAIREEMEIGNSVGEVKRIASQFSFLAPPDFLENNIRLHSNLEPLGCLGDLGWYCIRFALWVLHEALPQRVTGRILSETARADSPDSVPTEFSGELLYPGGVSAGFYCSFLTEHQQWANISGSRGNIQVDDFVLPYLDSEVAFTVNQAVFETRGCDFNMERHSRRVAVFEHSNSHPSAQETKLFSDFSNIVLSGRLQEKWAETALKTQRVLNACLTSAREGNREVNV